MLEPERLLLGRQEWVPGKQYEFACPTCHKRFRYDQPGEPLCSGPSESRDEHTPTLMQLVRVRTLAKTEKNAPPGLGEERAKGPLWIPTQT